VRRRLLVLVPSAALAVCLYAVRLPLYVEGPGPARDVLHRIDIDGTTTYQPQGRLLFTTVNLGRANLYDAVRAGVDPDFQVLPEQLVLGGLTEQQYDRLAVSQMDASKIAAVVAALELLTDYPRDHGLGVVVYDTVPGAPAHGRLFPGDLISAVDGVPIDDRPDLTEAIGNAGVGATLEVRVEPVEGSRNPETVRLRTVASEDGSPIIGIVPVANFPFEVSIQSGDVGGPSAGLMWALGVADLLAPGDLAEGRTVAGTGAIDLDGRVQPIGGVRAKVLAAERAGAELFLVPLENMAEARGAGDDIALAPVASLTEAVDHLEAG
jgi:PDZ domain-containing protein